MNRFYLLAVCLLALALIAFAAADQKPRVIPKQAKCKRDVDIKTNNKQNFILDLKAGCKADSGKGVAGRLRFSLKTNPLPRFELFAFKEDADSKEQFGLVFGFDRIVEYTNADGVAGFGGYHSGDIVHANYTVSSARLLKPTWGDLTYTPVKDETGAILYHKITTTCTQVSFADSVTIGVIVSPQEVSVTAGNSTVKRNILTPNSFKIDLEIKGIKYTRQDSTGIAIGAFLVSGKGANVRKTSRSSEEDPADGDAPDTSNTDQQVADVPDETDTSKSAGFLSWKTWLDARTKAGVAVTSKVVASSFVPDNSVEGESDDSKRVTRRVWFSPEGRPNDLVWDPALGTAEASTNSSSATRMASSVWIVIIAIVGLFFL